MVSLVVKLSDPHCKCYEVDEQDADLTRQDWTEMLFI